MQFEMVGVLRGCHYDEETYQLEIYVDAGLKVLTAYVHNAYRENETELDRLVGKWVSIKGFYYKGQNIAQYVAFNIKNKNVIREEQIILASFLNSKI